MCCHARHLALVLFALLLGGLGCGGDTVLVVRLEARPGVHDDDPGREADPQSLLVSFKSAANPAGEQTILNPKAGETIFPSGGARSSVFSIIANGREGPVKVGVQMRAPPKDKEPTGRVIGVGMSNATLLPGELVETVLTVLPTDFQVNTDYANTQLFTAGGSTGRQVAADKEGNFAVMWIDQECQGAGRCDIYGRLFDPRAKGRQNGERGTKLEFRVNPHNTTYDEPAIAMQQDGTYMVAWTNGRTDAIAIEVRAFLADGRQNPSASQQTRLSEAKKDTNEPDITALGDKTYAVCWAQDTSGLAMEVLCRKVDLNGTPIGAAISAATSNNTTRPFTTVAVAAGPQNGYMVTWREHCASGGNCWRIRGRIYNAVTNAFGALIDVSASQTKASKVDVTGLPYGYMVVWSDTVSGNPAEGSDILGRRINIKGQPLEEPYKVNTSVAGNQTQPTIAVLATGNILVAWTTDDNALDPAGGIRGRALLGNGLPVGNDVKLNYISAGVQDSPALAAAGLDAFVLVFRDDSKQGRDQIASGIRGALLYPDYDVMNRGVGARCTRSDASSCGAGLVCQQVNLPTGGDTRCVNACQQHGPCPNGGRCLKLAASNEFICVYQSG
ncbi:MAG: hypothetical protein CSA24_00215 [Deltaproteobacteria bacterium]|nr:MAG: hypothetical protein CSA24_00215 [Deltaproteobacteria bacterium]